MNMKMENTKMESAFAKTTTDTKGLWVCSTLFIVCPSIVCLTVGIGRGGGVHRFLGDRELNIFWKSPPPGSFGTPPVGVTGVLDLGSGQDCTLEVLVLSGREGEESKEVLRSGAEKKVLARRLSGG